MASIPSKTNAIENANVEKETGLEPGTSRRGIAKIVLIFSILIAALMYAINSTTVAVVQVDIVQKLGDVDKLPWITVAFQLGGVSANLWWGKLYGRFDCKPLFITSVLLFQLGCILCGAASTMDMLIVGRVIANFGGNGLYIGIMNLLSNLSTIRERPLYLSFYGITWAIGVVLGPLVGGGFASNPQTGWRWSFYINPCIGAAVLPLYVFLLPASNPQPGRTVLGRVKELDFVGAIIFIGAYVSGVMAISFGGTTYAWNSGQTIALFCVSGTLWIVFICQQAFCLGTTPQERLFPVHLLRDYENWIFFVETASGIAALFLGVYYVPLYFQFIRGYTPIKSAICILPLICVGAFFCLLNGALMGVLGYYTPWFLAGAIAVVISAALLRTVDPGTKDSTIFGYTTLLGLGVGSFIQASFAVAQAKQPAENSSAVLAFVGCAQLSGLTLSFAVGNAIFINRATERIHHILPGQQSAQIQAAIVGAGAEVFQNLSADTQEKVLEAVSSSISDVYTQILTGGVLSLVAALFLRREKLFKRVEEPVSESDARE